MAMDTGRMLRKFSVIIFQPYDLFHDFFLVAPLPVYNSGLRRRQTSSLSRFSPTQGTSLSALLDIAVFSNKELSDLAPILICENIYNTPLATPWPFLVLLVSTMLSSLLAPRVVHPSSIWVWVVLGLSRSIALSLRYVTSADRIKLVHDKW